MKKLAFLLSIGLLLGACNEEEAAPVTEEKAPAEEVESAEAEPIEVEVTTEAEIEDGKATISGTTNLPDDAELMTTIENVEADFRAQSKNKVQDGAFTSDTFSNKGESLPAGNYTVTVSLSIPSTQSEAFKEKAGSDYENLSGDLMEDSDLGKSMSYETEFTIE